MPRQPLYPHIPKGQQSKQPAVITAGPRPPREGEVLEFLPDSAENLAQTIQHTGYREKIGDAFQAAIARAKERR